MAADLFNYPSVGQYTKFADRMTAFKRGAALKAAIELNLFTVFSEGSQSSEWLALRLQILTRGVRILCDYPTIEGFLIRENWRYTVTPDTARFLNRESPTYIGSAAYFLRNPMLVENYRDLARCVRKGGTVNPDNGTNPEHPIWDRAKRLRRMHRIVIAA